MKGNKKILVPFLTGKAKEDRDKMIELNMKGIIRVDLK